MQRYRKLFMAVSLVLLLGLTLTGLASADVIRGKGWLHAEGSGVATLKMSGHVEIVSHDKGVVYIYGAEKIEAEGDGKRSDLRGGGVVFRGYEGVINASGARMRVKIIGEQIEFTARGKGTIFLRGRGHYESEGLAGDWANSGLNIEVEE
jgi:hypothetical protein